MTRIKSDPDAGERTGEWRTLRLDWARPTAVACRLCGRPLFGRVWSAEAGGERADFCGPDCATLFVEYWLPRYGARPPGP